MFLVPFKLRFLKCSFQKIQQFPKKRSPLHNNNFDISAADKNHVILQLYSIVHIFFSLEELEKRRSQLQKGLSSARVAAADRDEEYNSQILSDLFAGEEIRLEKHGERLKNRWLFFLLLWEELVL